MITTSTRKRPYRSPYRQAGAQRTRQAIVTAALRLHAQGVSELAAVAAEAGVAQPTLYRHFPSREALLAACAPDLDAPLAGVLTRVRAVPERGARLLRAVRGVYALYERNAARVWAAWALRAGSPAMEEAAGRVEEALVAIAAAVTRRAPTATPAPSERALLGLLNPLTLRALRGAGLSAEQALAQAVSMATAVLATSRRS
jgi:AcrR family transcriptional regulator